MQLPQQVTKVAPSYRPSWVDRLADWAGRQRLPAWLLYPALGLALLFATLLVLWAGGAPATGTTLLYYALSSFGQAYLLALMHHLDQAAEAVLARFRPVMTVDQAGYDRLRYQLTTMPARPAAIAFGLGLFYATAALLLNLPAGRPGANDVPPPALAVYVGHSLLLAGLAASLAYHTLHQLRTVSLIYTAHTRYNLFRLGPLYALSTLAARTAIGFGLPTYLWFWLNYSVPGGPSLTDLLSSAFFATLIVVTFVWPLLGAHRRLALEKQRLRDDVAQRIEATIAALHHCVDVGELDDRRGMLNDTLEALTLEQGVIEKLRTWPWRTETASSVVGAFFVPLVVGMIQRLLGRLGF